MSRGDSDSENRNYNSVSQSWLYFITSNDEVLTLEIVREMFDNRFQNANFMTTVGIRQFIIPQYSAEKAERSRRT